jgi:plastocyanin
MEPRSTRRPRRLGPVAILAVVAAVATGVVLLVTGGPEQQRETTIHTVTFPPGATFAIDPSVFDGIPYRSVGSVVWLELEVGDTLVVRNEDAFNHQLWAINVRPGETVGHTFTEQGTFSGECTFDLTVFIEVR